MFGGGTGGRSPPAPYPRLGGSRAVGACIGVARGGSRWRRPLYRYRRDEFRHCGTRGAALAVSGSPRAAAVISALRDGHLFASRWPRPDAPLYIRTADGFVDARTGLTVAALAPVNLRLVIVADSVRAAIDTAEGALDLSSQRMTAARQSAANALFQSAEAGALPLIEQALATEHDAAVRRVLREAHAAALLKSGTGSILGASRCGAQRCGAGRSLSAQSAFLTARAAASGRGGDRRSDPANRPAAAAMGPR